jgi:hypothetical protein
MVLSTISRSSIPTGFTKWWLNPAAVERIRAGVGGKHRAKPLAGYDCFALALRRWKGPLRTAGVAYVVASQSAAAPRANSKPLAKADGDPAR